MTRWQARAARWAVLVVSGVVSLVASGAAPAPAQPAIQSGAPGQAGDASYRLLATQRTGTLQSELREAAAEGYRIRNAWGSAREVLALLSKVGDDEPPAGDIQLLAAVSRATLNLELAQAARDGYRLVPNGLLRNPGKSGGDLGAEVVLLLEQLPSGAAPFDYHVSRATIRYDWNGRQRRYVADNYDEFEAQLDRMSRFGYDLVGIMGQAQGERRGAPCDFSAVLLWERPASAIGRPELPAAQARSYRLVEGIAGVGLSMAIRRATADGFRLTSTSRAFDLPGAHHVALVMERVDAPDPVPEYLAFSAFTPEGLKNQINAAGAHGYRVVRWGLLGGPLTVLAERAVGEDDAYAYDFVETERTEPLQRALSDAHRSRDTQVVAATSIERRSYQMDRNAPPSLDNLFGVRPLFLVRYGFTSHLGLVESPLGPRTEPSPPTGGATAAPLRVVSLALGRHPRDIERRLNDTASHGWRILLLGTMQNGYWLDVAFEAHDVGGGRPEYRVLTTTRDSTMKDELNDLASQGFRLVRGGVFRKPTRMHGIEIAAVMERLPGDGPRHEYVVLSAFQDATLRDEVGDAATRGYRVVGELVGTAFMERPLPE